MYVVLEKGNDVTVGTVMREPDEFTYQIFILSIRELATDQTELTSELDIDVIRANLKKASENLEAKLKAITERTMEETSIYDWYTYMDRADGKKDAHQIVTDATYSEGKLILRYNHAVRDLIIKLKIYYKDHGDEIIKQL